MTYISSLSICDARNGWLSGLFGTSKICDEYFTDKHKVKTKFWNQDYLLLNSIGISVKNQKKYLGIWINNRPTEVGYGIYEAQFAFNIPLPEYPSVETVYIHNEVVYDKYGKVKGSSPPAWPFESPFEIYVPLPIKPLDLEYSAKELNKLFWGQVWDQAKSAIKSIDDTDKKDVTFIGFLPDKVHVLYTNISNSKLNRAVIDHVFDWNFEIGWKTNMHDIAFDISKAKIGGLYKYSEAQIDFYGYVKSGDRYKGSRLKFKEK